MTATGWRETWVRGNDADWERLIAGRDERLGDAVHSKEHYLELVSDFFKEARQIPKPPRPLEHRLLGHPVPPTARMPTKAAHP